MYVQTEGVAMGSPLGPTFANFFMSEVEKQALQNIAQKPNIYCRYVDDIFLLCEEPVLQTLKNEMKLISGLNFTAEYATDNKLPYLNVLVERTTAGFKTIVYRKSTDVGSCMNGKGDSPRQYRISVIKGFLHRAKTLCSDHGDLLIEMNRSKQILINNGYTNAEVDTEIRGFLKTLNQQNTKPRTGNRYDIYFRNYMNSSYQQDERSIKDIIKENICMTKKEDALRLVIYYKSLKTSNMVMKNNLGPKPRELAKTHVIYDIRCKKGVCEHLPDRNTTYTGLTKCTMSRRLSFHLQDGAFQRHHVEQHLVKITRKQIESATKTRYIERDANRLSILESLIIHYENPEINKQDTGTKRTLKLYGNR